MHIEDEAEFARINRIHTLNRPQYAFEEILQISISKGYQLLAEGRLKGVRVGGSMRVTGQSLIAFLRSCEPAVITTGQRLSAEENAKLAETSPQAAKMREQRRGLLIGAKLDGTPPVKRGRGRPFGSKSRPRADAPALENDPST